MPQLNIRDPYTIALLRKLAKQDAKRQHAPMNMTATLRELLNAEDQRRTFTWHDDRAAAQTAEEQTK